MALGEIFSFAYDTFCSNKVRFILTALGMVIGTASLILVVTIGMTGRQYVLNQIQSIGTNEVWAEYLGGAPHISNSNPDPLTVEDLQAVRQEVFGVVASSGRSHSPQELLPQGFSLVLGLTVPITIACALFADDLVFVLLPAGITLTGVLADGQRARVGTGAVTAIPAEECTAGGRGFEYHESSSANIHCEEHPDKYEDP